MCVCATPQDRLRYEREKQHQLQTDQSRKELSAGGKKQFCDQ